MKFVKVKFEMFELVFIKNYLSHADIVYITKNMFGSINDPS